MAKYHINGDSVSPCRATKGHCPFDPAGDGDNHYEDAGEAMKVLEERLSDEHGGTNPPALSKSKPAPKTAKDLADSGADGKEVRDALRKENPGWSDRQVHTVYGRMAKGSGSSGSGKTGSTRAPAKTNTRAEAPKNPISAAEAKNLVTMMRKAVEDRKKIEVEKTQNYEADKAYDAKYGAQEGRAYYYDYSAGSGKVPGVNPNGHTYFTPTPEQEERGTEIYNRFTQTLKDEEDAQTMLEEGGYGHMIPDSGNTIRVNNQAQKWLLKNELQGQISDGHWENHSHNPWQDWSNAKVIVDPKNVGRNFRTIKDNYQLNSKALLDVVGDRMIDDVKARTGKTDYDMKTMNEDLKDLRKIFKTKRDNHDPSD